MAPAASAIVPIEVPVRPRSWMIRAITGNAVIDSEAPMNSAAWLTVSDSAKNPPEPCSTIAAPIPSANGARMPVSETDAACFSDRRSRVDSNSRPTVNMYKRQRNLRDAEDHRHHLRLEQVGRYLRRGPAEERRPEQESRDHLGDHLRLPQPAGDEPYQLACGDDGQEQEKDVEGELGVRHATGPSVYSPSHDQLERRKGPETMTDWLGLLPHRPPMRLVGEVIEVEPGVRARTRRRTQAEDWFFDGHFPGEPVVPAIVLVELVAQTGGLAIGSGAADGEPLALRVAALGGFKFPGAAVAGDVLEVSARVAGRMGGLYKIEGEVTVDGRTVGAGSVTLAEARQPPSPAD